MAGKTINWEALKAEWVNRRLAGESLSKKAFAAEQGVSYTWLRQNGASWTAELAEREAAITTQVNEAADKTHTEHRRDYIQLADEGLRPLIEAQVRLWQVWTEVQAPKIEERIRSGEKVVLAVELPCLKDLCTLVDKYEKIKTIGAGLAKEVHHQHEEVPTKIRTNRAQMEGIKGDVFDLAEYRRNRGKGGSGKA